MYFQNVSKLSYFYVILCQNETKTKRVLFAQKLVLEANFLVERSEGLYLFYLFIYNINFPKTHRMTGLATLLSFSNLKGVVSFLSLTCLTVTFSEIE